MPIELDHVLVPARDRFAAAARIAQVLDVPWSATGVGPFCPVYVNDHLTLDVDQADGDVPTMHFCFRIDDASFDALLGRLRALGIAFRSGPHGAPDMRVGSHGGGRLVYWSEPDGHVWEALTVSYARAPSPTISR